MIVHNEGKHQNNYFSAICLTPTPMIFACLLIQEASASGDQKQIPIVWV